MFLIVEFENADWVNLWLRPPIRRKWEYSGEDFRRIATLDNESTRHDQSIDDLVTDKTKFYFKLGYVAFHIAPDRKHVFYQYHLGPLYARWQVLQVRYQGKRGLLERARG